MKKPIDVTTLNLYAKRLLQASELQNIIVQGEITNFNRHYKTGHCYFTLRDPRSSVKAVMFVRQASLLGFRPEDGIEVLAYGSASLYERDGAFQLYVDYMRPAGVGSAQKAFDRLKETLGREGLFDPAHKKPLPAMPDRIGIVTSKTGAALQDILNIAARRWPMVKLLLAPVSVQGKTAEQEIAAAIRALDRDGRSDIILVTRGGGSREDLWVFNSELIARAAFACKTPLVSAVGHEIDVTILDYVADLRAPTPSAAAELCLPDRDEWRRKLQILAKNMQNSIQDSLQMCYNRMNTLEAEKAMRACRTSLEKRQETLRLTEQQLAAASKSRLTKGEERLAACAALAASYNPYGVLARGYALVLRDNVPAPVEALSAGEEIVLLGAKAKARCRVEEREDTDEAAQKL